MSVTRTTMDVKDAAAVTKHVGVLDTTGSGAELDTIHAVVDSAGNLINPATNEALVTLTGSAGTSPPALAAGATGTYGWLRKIVDTGATDATLTAGIGTVGVSPPSLPTGATGLVGWLRKLADLILPLSTETTLATRASETTLLTRATETTLATRASDTTLSTGIGAAGASPPALASGASGLLGYLRKIVDQLTAALTVKNQDGAGNALTSRALASGAVRATDIAIVDASGAQISSFAPAATQAVDGSMAITTGGSAQPLFSSVVPVNGFGVYNPDASEDLWICDGGTAAPNGQGSIRIAANGGGYETPYGARPIGIVSIYGATTNHKVTAKRW